MVGKNRQWDIRLFILALTALMLPALPVWVGQGLAEEGSVYTRYNIHVEKRFSRNGEPVYKASYAGYVNPPSGEHIILPPNTQIIPINKRRLFTKNYSFQVVGQDMSVVFEFDAKRMGMDYDQYMELICSPQPVSLKGLNKVDLTGVQKGKALIGMTKQGVMTALGYPAAHRTPSLDDNSWTYWRDRFRTMRVEFDQSGRVSKVIE